MDYIVHYCPKEKAFSERMYKGKMTNLAACINRDMGARWDVNTDNQDPLTGCATIESTMRRGGGTTIYMDEEVN